MSTKIEWTEETWLPVNGSAGYFVNQSGQILGPSGKILHPISARRTGHLYVFMHRKKKWVHRVVLEAFVGPCPQGHEGRHLDDNPKHNNLMNLAWGTRLENAQDKRRNGHLLVGEKVKTAKLTEAAVLEIRRRVGSETLRALAREYGVSHTAIRRAANGMKWGYLK